MTDNTVATEDDVRALIKLMDERRFVLPGVSLDVGHVTGTDNIEKPFLVVKADTLDELLAVCEDLARLAPTDPISQALAKMGSRPVISTVHAEPRPFKFFSLHPKPGLRVA